MCFKNKVVNFYCSQMWPCSQEKYGTQYAKLHEPLSISYL